MMYEYVMFMDTETQVAYAPVNEDNTVSIVIERPRDWGFDRAECLLPTCNWSMVDGFSEEDLEFFREFLRNNMPLIYKKAKAVAHA